MLRSPSLLDSVPRRSSTTLFAALFLWCAALILARWVWLGERYYAFLGWNLILAAIPYAAALGFEMHARARRLGFVAVALLALWLLFLPNAPYLVTDLMHLGWRPPVPIWFDSALVVSCAGTGVLLGCASVSSVQRGLTPHVGRVLASVAAASACLLSGFGVYLGRVLRWNSWEVVTDPLPLFTDILSRLASPISHPRMVGMTLLYGAGLWLATSAMQALADDARDRPTGSEEG